MLVGEHRCRHEHGSLFIIGCRLECRTYSHFRFSESYITAYQSVHGTVTLHIGLHCLGRGKLVGGILVDKRCFQLILHIGVRGKSKPFFLLTRCIEFNQVSGYILELRLSPFLDTVPGSGTEFVDFWRHSLFATIFG